MPKRMPGKRHARHGRPRLWIEYSPWWLRHPSEAVKVLNRNADYFERKIKALRELAKAFAALAAGSRKAGMSS
jgi:hypothetical protein